MRRKPLSNRVHRAAKGARNGEVSRKRQRSNYVQHARQRRTDPLRDHAVHDARSMSPLDVWVFRDNKQLAHGGSLLRSLERSIAQVARLRVPASRQRAALETLVMAGEIESALADANDPLEAVVAEATNALASVVIGQPADLALCAEGLVHARAPRSLAIAPHRGFAYFALQPEAYAAASKIVESRSAVVVGIHPMGRTLAAVTAAALRARGVSAKRIAVRAEGAGGGRHVVLGAEAQAALRRVRDENATVVVVHEGPGRSGSTLLAAAGAVVDAGVPRERVLFIVGRPIDPERLCAPDAAERLCAFRTVVAPSSMFGPVNVAGRAGAVDVSRGLWRELHYTNEQQWPSVIEVLERQKVLAGGRLFKFEGLGFCGLAARHRASALAAEGISLDPSDEGAGWTSYAWGGHPLSQADLDSDLIDCMARYCARRPSLCPLVSAESDLAPVVAKNLAAVLGEVPNVPALELIRIATTDGRFAPHEWLRLDDGSIRKTDGIAHGDDHFFPGPTDVAWDLAGAIVEWEMDRDARELLLGSYRRASGDDVSRRIEPWIIAYTSLRAAICLFAIGGASASEAARLKRDFARYRSRLVLSVERCKLASG
jgi:hypothetical protein